MRNFATELVEKENQIIEGLGKKWRPKLRVNEKFILKNKEIKALPAVSAWLKNPNNTLDVDRRLWAVDSTDQCNTLSL